MPVSISQHLITVGLEKTRLNTQ